MSGIAVLAPPSYAGLSGASLLRQGPRRQVATAMAAIVPNAVPETVLQTAPSASGPSPSDSVAVAEATNGLVDGGGDFRGVLDPRIASRVKELRETEEDRRSYHAQRSLPSRLHHKLKPDSSAAGLWTRQAKATDSAVFSFYESLGIWLQQEGERRGIEDEFRASRVGR